ncbi:MAG: DMT family transporter [Prevotellaceae bacterium]|nr:DMT family transporter [Prevotellaceae bacterium]MDO4931719.1 DMT family transporter [Prevotellaceae bacterium]
MNTRLSTNNAYLRLHLGILIASGTGIFGRMISLTELPLVWYRLLIAGLTLAGIMFLNHRLHRIPLRNLAKICGCGTLLTIHWIFFYASIKASNVSIAVVCIALDGFFTAILDPIISRRRFSIREIMLSLITLAGILLIFGFDARYRLGILLGVSCSFTYALFSIYSKRVQQTTGHKSSTMLMYEIVGGWALLSVIMPVYITYINPQLNIVPTIADTVMLLVFGSIFTVGPFLMQLQALRSISAFTVNLSYNLEPLYSIVLAMIIFNEGSELSRYFWLGVMMTILSVVLQTIYSRRPHDIKP